MGTLFQGNHLPMISPEAIATSMAQSLAGSLNVNNATPTLASLLTNPANSRPIIYASPINPSFQSSLTPGMVRRIVDDLTAYLEPSALGANLLRTAHLDLSALAENLVQSLDVDVEAEGNAHTVEGELDEDDAADAADAEESS